MRDAATRAQLVFSLGALPPPIPPRDLRGGVGVVQGLRGVGSLLRKGLQLDLKTGITTRPLPSNQNVEK